MVERHNVNSNEKLLELTADGWEATDEESTNYVKALKEEEEQTTTLIPDPEGIKHKKTWGKENLHLDMLGRLKLGIIHNTGDYGKHVSAKHND